MADNVDITAGTGTSIAADDVGSVYYQQVKLDGGGDGVSVPIEAGQQLAAASLPVVLASDQGALPVTDNSTTLSVDDGGGALTVDGTVAVTNAGITTIAGAVAGTEMQVDVVSSALPSGAATSALQGGGLPAALGAGGGLKVDGSGTALPVSLATAPALVAGTATIGATMDAGPAWTPAYLHTASADATGIVDVTAAPTAGQKIVIDDIIVSVSVGMTVTFEEETAHTDIIVLYLAANSTAQITPRGRIKLPTADKKLQIDTSVAGNIAVTVCYHSEA